MNWADIDWTYPLLSRMLMQRVRRELGKRYPGTMTVTMVRMSDGTEISASDATCEGCGSSLADHSCGGATGGGSVTYTSTRSTGPRKPASAHPTCGHCGGRIHFNMSQTAVNAECMTRQYAVDPASGPLMTDPNGRLPVLTLELMDQMVTWAKSLATPLTYGKMETAAGGAATYSGLRPKTGRKKKTAPAAPGAQIQDMAVDVEGTITFGEDSEETPATKPKRTRKSKGPKVSKLTVAEDGAASVESVDLEAAVEEATNGHESEITFPEDSTADVEDSAPVASSAEEPRKLTKEERAARRAARRAALPV